MRVYHMPAATIWTEEMDAQILRLRKNGYSWLKIGKCMRKDRALIVSRAIEIDAFLPFVWSSMPAGAPDSWDAINAGTSIEGYPFMPPGELR